MDWLKAELPGLGDALTDAVAALTERLRRLPRLGPPVGLPGLPADVRPVEVRRLSYVLVYRVRGDVLPILALAHTRRRPGYWRARAG